MLGVNRQELQASIDAVLTFGILWLEECRTAHAGRLAVEGLKLFLPGGCSALARERMAHLSVGSSHCSASDRAMIDVLTLTREGRLVVLALKADEDIHLPLQGIDYWARVTWHHERGEFQTFGYFAGRNLSPQPPLLMMVAPVFHVHPATDTLLRYLAPEIEWTLLGIDERWRKELRVVFRKRPERVRLRTAE